MTPLRVAEDRALAIPAGKIVRTAYAPIDSIRLACRDRMDIGAVEKAMQRRLGIQPAQPWPCPNGRWESGAFILADGRHDYVAALLLGIEHILVAWVEDD